MKGKRHDHAKRSDLSPKLLGAECWSAAPPLPARERGLGGEVERPRQSRPFGPHRMSDAGESPEALCAVRQVPRPAPRMGISMNKIMRCIKFAPSPDLCDKTADNRFIIIRHAASST